MVVEVLENAGHEVLSAATAEQALALLGHRASPVALLLTDAVLPGDMNGRELADRARQARPGLAVLFMSGYSRNALIRDGRLDDGVQVLQKPFRRTELMEKVREALAAASVAPP